jgi:alkaline phosphatase D
MSAKRRDGMRLRRRQVIAGLGASAAGLAMPTLGHTLRVRSPARAPRLNRLPRRIAFGSCADQNKPQPIWAAIESLRPDLFIFLGDNIYGDTVDMQHLAEQYRKLAQQPGFRNLCARTPVLAMWDDHDYGENDAGADYPCKEESRRIFCDFWNVSANSPRRRRAGVYDSVVFAARGRQLQIVLPDLRYNRTPLRPRTDARTAMSPGPYVPQTDAGATILGAEQWRWLEAELARPVDLRILASSLQVVAEYHGWEAWANFPAERARLLDAIRAGRAERMICLSGDMHYGELSKLATGLPYPLYDLTSSGLTETWEEPTPNIHRVGRSFAQANFGVIDLDWRADDVGIVLQVRDETGTVLIEASSSAAALVSA